MARQEGKILDILHAVTSCYVKFSYKGLVLRVSKVHVNSKHSDLHVNKSNNLDSGKGE